MAANLHRGEVGLALGGRDLVVVYDWNGLAKLRNELGANYLEAIARAADTTDLDVLAKALSIGLEKHQPGAFSPKQVAELSPPVVPVVRAINAALTAANWGPEKPPSDEDAPQEVGDENPTRTLWGKLSSWLAKRG